MYFSNVNTDLQFLKQKSRAQGYLLAEFSAVLGQLIILRIWYLSIFNI
uniref:Uncharacterized protein n=1 Tax=Anguilla anguilla TaxID=7936 RepID=A0A0E9QFG8_ANGAN